MKHQIPNLQTLVWPDRGLNPMIYFTITPLIQYCSILRGKCWLGLWVVSVYDTFNTISVISWQSVHRSLVCCVMFCRSLFVLFLLAIVLSCLWFMASDYPIDIFKLVSSWWRNQEYQEKTIDQTQVTDKYYHIIKIHNRGSRHRIQLLLLYK